MVQNTQSKLTNLRQAASALDQQAMPFISAARLLEAYGKLTYELSQHAQLLEAEIQQNKQQVDQK